MRSFSNTGCLFISLHSGPGAVPAHGRGRGTARASGAPRSEQQLHHLGSRPQRSPPPGGFQRNPRPAVPHGQHGWGKQQCGAQGKARGGMRGLRHTGPPVWGHGFCAWSSVKPPEDFKQGHLLMICPLSQLIFLGTNLGGG